MRDVLGRTIKEGDLVCAKGTGRCNNGLNIGIYMGNSVQFLNFRANYTELFLIENPSKTEIEHKNKILEEVREREEEKRQLEEKRKALKRIPKKDLIIGGVYKTDKGEKLVYLGKGTIKEFSFHTKESEGFILINVNYKVLDDEDANKLNFELCRHAYTRKTLPKFVEKLKPIFDLEGLKTFDLKAKMELMYSYTTRIIINLD